METLIAVLRRPPMAAEGSRDRAGVPIWRRGVRWALAASVVVAAFAGGRITGLTTSGQATLTADASANGLGNRIAMADAGARTPASYGLYIDDLMDVDAADNQRSSDQGGGDNQDSQIDEDSGAF